MSDRRRPSFDFSRLLRDTVIDAELMRPKRKTEPRVYTEDELAERRKMARWFMDSLRSALRHRGVIVLPVTKRLMTADECRKCGVRLLAESERR